MASIPLACNICPKHPDFSDISHLLTHVSSKGHLSHYFQAQVRGQHDEAVRNELAIFDAWFDKHNIQKLLAQRLTSKGSRGGAPRQKTSAKASKKTAPNAQKKSAKVPLTPAFVLSSPPPIDPQLSTRQDENASPGQSPHNRSNHKGPAFVPRMIGPSPVHAEQQDDTKSVGRRLTFTYKIQSGQSEDDEDVCFAAFLRSPSRPAYPDPSQLQTEGASVDAETTAPKPKKPQVEKVKISSEALKPAVLKGVKWPGMSLFDSASSEVQRLRNQKKDDSILAQMESDSTAIEPTEVIYWPDGLVKKAREITGNVESSPLSESPPPPKRQRPKASKPRIPLADLDVNRPPSTTAASRRAKRLSPEDDQEIASPTRKPKRRRPQKLPVGDAKAPSTPGDEQEDYSFGNTPSRSRFTVFRDGAVSERDLEQSPSIRAKMRPILDNGNPFTEALPASRGLLQRAPFPSWSNPFTFANARRDQSHCDSSAGLDASHDSPSAVGSIGSGDNQRYFVMTRGQPTQVYTALPPQMEYGGLAGPRYLGATLNPLNPKYRRPHPQYASYGAGLAGPQIEDNSSARYPTYNARTHDST